VPPPLHGFQERGGVEPICSTVSPVRQRCASPLGLGGDQVADTRHQIELDVGAALECAEAATWTANELVARTLETAVTGKEAATTLHHAYSAQVHVARVLEWAKEWAHSRGLALPKAPPSILGDCLTWMRRARGHAEKLCRCFPASEAGGRWRNGQRGGRKIMRKPKAALKNRWKK